MQHGGKNTEYGIRTFGTNFSNIFRYSVGWVRVYVCTSSYQDYADLFVKGLFKRTAKK